MATTTPDNIQYPVNSDQVAPLASHFKNLADSTQAALNTKADSDDPRLSDQRTPLDNSVTSAKIANGAIVDADVNASAAIAATKVQGTLPTGGGVGQVLAKSTTSDYATTWVDGTALPASQIKQLVKNETGSTIPKGAVVYISGANGTNILIALADADTEPTSSKTIGLTETAINNGASGYVVTEGLLGNLNTNSATAGQSVWLSSTPGEVVYGAPPAKPAHGVYLGVVSRANTNNGEIFVKVQNGYELEELHNVSINSGTLADKQVLAYEESSQLWKNKQATGGVTVGATAPAGPNAGDAWYNSNNGMLYVWYVDADSTAQWVQVKANSGLEASILSRLGGLESQAIAMGAMSPNYVINGAFDIWQRGTTFARGAGTGSGYGSADRWKVGSFGSAPAVTLARSTDIPTNSGLTYSGAMSWASSTGSGDVFLTHVIEDGKYKFAGKTVTVSFYAKAANAITVGGAFDQDYAGTNFSITTSWQRYSFTVTLPSTYQTSYPSGAAAWDHTEIRLFRMANVSAAANTITFTGVQVEIGSTATAFRRNAPSIQAELAACQRYYYRLTGYGAGYVIVHGTSVSGTQAEFNIYKDMRVGPTSFEASNVAIYRLAGIGVGGSTYTLYAPTPTNTVIRFTGGGGSFTNPTPENVIIYAASAGGYIALNAEL